LLKAEALLFASTKNTHDDCSGTVGTLVLAQVVGTRELLAAVSALEWLVVSVEGTVVTLEVFLAAEAAAAKSADECLGWIIGKRLLATTAGGA